MSSILQNDTNNIQNLNSDIIANKILAWAGEVDNYLVLKDILYLKKKDT